MRGIVTSASGLVHPSGNCSNPKNVFTAEREILYDPDVSSKSPNMVRINAGSPDAKVCNNIINHLMMIIV